MSSLLGLVDRSVVLFVLNPGICPMLHQHLAHVQITTICCHVEGRVTISLSLSIHLGPSNINRQNIQTIYLTISGKPFHFHIPVHAVMR